MSIANMKVGTRLVTSFGIVSLLLILIIGIGVTKLANLNAGTNLIINDRWPKIDLARDILAQADNIAIALRDMMLTDSKEDRQSQFNSIMESRRVAEENIDRLQSTIVTPKGKELLRKVIDRRAKYMAGQDKLMGLVGEGKQMEMRAFLANELRPALAAYKEALSNLVRFQVELIDASGKSASETYKDARTLMIALGAIALMLATIVGFLITRSLLKQLGGEPDYAVAIAGRIAAGDLTVAVNIRENDHVSMLYAMRAMRDNLAHIVAQVRQGTDTIATASGQIAAGNLDLSSRTEQQASSLEETASSMEEL
ncbi:MAG TPA: MCP four helix bundle domain-containing protein, partial [Burkholderiaceae bacterium]|nr:MCP four helix bundle domain-containing protein [Burkholderiaceae bacterium]